MTDPAVPKESPLYNSAANAACASAGFSARCTYAKGYEDGFRQAGVERGRCDAYMLRLDAAESRLAVEASRADVAEQRVCELREACVVARPFTLTSKAIKVIDAALASTADIAGRWRRFDDVDANGVDRACLIELLRRRQHGISSILDAFSAIDRAVAHIPDGPHCRQRDALTRVADDLDRAIAERDAAIARAEKAEARLGHVMMVHQQAERARDEVGIQYAAAQAVIALMRPVVEAARAACAMTSMGFLDDTKDALATLDTVQGDALAPVDTEDPAAGLLAASGIDVKGVG